MAVEDDGTARDDHTTETTPEMAPEEAFALVGHEMRFAILRALWDAGEESLSFSELRTAVGNPDAGNFNYHLRKLLGPFVQKLESEDGGYELTVAAGYVMGAIESGGYHRSESVGPVRVDATCPECEGVVEAQYEDDKGRVACVDCDHRMFNAPMPPGAVAPTDADGLAELFNRWIRAVVRRVSAHICPVCAGRVNGRLVLDDENPVGEFRCEQCDRTVTAGIAAWLIEHPALVQFSMNHEVDPRKAPLWSTHWQQAVETVVVETEPPLAVVSITIDGDTLEIVVDDTMTVVETRRHWQ
ncbi:winged helix-turn-helix domain-containing protein [Haloarchaeobius amylolyticus]|uniref:winged helix-turn-helix domain-containing protein n=1 Tax=Haloarchaeobius amylolyticus TaxID=1198296 RepID=UPI00227112D7|nr:helix-turn-helix domain-containing protein [Haloarchaeobius amylolyticus]